MKEVLLGGALAVIFAAAFLGLAWSVGLHRSRSRKRTRAYFAIQAVIFGLIVVWTGPEVVFAVLGALLVISFGAALAFLSVLAIRARQKQADLSFERVMAANILVSPALFAVAAVLRAILY